MQRVWPRCPKCGRRWQAAHAACGTEVAPAPHAAPVGEDMTPAPPPALPQIAGLNVERLLGRGGFGEVLLAIRVADGRKVAVKIPNNDPDAIMRLELEGETLRQLGGVHAPALYDIPTLADGRPAVVMEFVPMPTLADRLGELENGMPLDEIGRRGLSLLTALEAIHRLDLVHRDLKPENIFSTDQPPVTRIFDFGLVKPPAGQPQQDTTVGTFMGTPEYMAPEQLDSSAPVDQRADIYAVGAIFYEMLAGRPPFWGNAAEVQQALANRRAPRPARYVTNAPRALEDVILRCLAKDPVRRFASTTELIAAFQAAVAEAQSTTAPPPPATPAGAPATEAKAAAPAPAKRPMAILAVHGIAVDVLMKTLASGGGHLVDVGRGGGVGLFTDKTSENPVMRAIRMADGLLARKACRSVIVDVAAVAVRKKPDGTDRYVSAAFAKLQKQAEGTTDGLFLTAAVAELAPDRRGHAAAETGLVAALPPAREDDALTVVRSAQAPIFGRGDEIKRLLGALRAVISARRPGLATILADGGLGKSHLCAALVEDAKRMNRDANVVELRVREPIEGDPDANLRALLGRCFALPAEKPADNGAALLGELGPALWPAAALTLGWMTPDEPELRTLAAAPGMLRATVSRSVGQALRLRAQERPLAVILDDAHHADDATLEAIEYATMPEAEVPLWICVAARPSLTQMKPSWGDRSGGDHLRMDLGPLASDAATELARRLLYPLEHIPAAALETLVTGTHGNPFLLSELIRGLKRDNIIRRDPKTGVYFIATDELAKLPDLAVTDWLAEREIGGLPPELAAHARLCALLGTDFAEDEVEGVLSELERNTASGSPDADLRLDPHVATRQLVSMAIFKRQRGGRAAFRHTLLRAAVEKSVSDKFRAEVHAAAFRFYRAATGLDESVRLARVASHAAGAGYRAEAGPVYLDLADRARERHRYLDAESLYTRALALLDKDDLRQRMVALRGRGLMRFRVSRNDAADDLSEARAAAQQLGDRVAEVEIILETATALDWMVEYAKSNELVEEAASLFEKLEGQNDFLRAAVLVGQGRSFWRVRDQERGIEKFQEGITIAEPLGDQAYEIRVMSLLMLGQLLVFQGRVVEAETTFETLMSLAEAHGDQSHLMGAYMNRRVLWLGRRNLERALDDTRKCIQIAREMGLVAQSFMAEFNLGELLYSAGDAEAAWPHVRRSVELEVKQLSGVPSPAARLLEARLLVYLGRDQEARRLIDELSALQAEAERKGDQNALFAPTERVLFSLVDLCTREAPDEEWAELHARARTDSWEGELVEVVEMTALALGRRGRIDDARRALAEALALAETTPHVMDKRLAQAKQLLQAGAPLSRTG
jgi:tetratricopeptide (TPR) repeat protein